jgi:hypothetical protein
VPYDWQHPKHEVPDYRTGRMVERYKPLYPGERYAPNAAEFLAKANAEGLQEAIESCGCPDKDDYMPDWPAEQRTHLMMYEDTSEGTPISPAFATPEELARWLTDTGASSFGSNTASYEGWLRVAKGGWALSAVSIGGGPLVSGVDAL